MTDYCGTCEFYQAQRRRDLKGVEFIAVDEAHAAHLKELARNQLASLPVTIMHDILDDQIPVVEQLCYSKAIILHLS